MLESFCTWLAATAPSVAMSGTMWVVPTVQTVHILAIGILMASVVMLDLKLVGLAGRNLSLEATNKRFTPWVWGSLSILLPTGIMLVIIEPARELLNVGFRAKMVLLLIVVAITAWLQRRLAGGTGAQLPEKAAAAVSLVLWLAIIICGRWIAYLQ